MTEPIRSSIGPAKAALIDAIRAAVPAGQKVQVAYGHPGRFQHDDVIAVFDVQDGQQVVANRGYAEREERYTFLVACGSYTGQVRDDAQRKVTERALELMGIVEDACRAAPTLGGRVIDAKVTGRVTVDEADPNELKVTGRVAEVQFGVTCHFQQYP